jgi:hypothetical protein
VVLEDGDVRCPQEAVERVTEPEADADRSAEAKVLIGLNVMEQYLGRVVVARNAE